MPFDSKACKGCGKDYTPQSGRSEFCDVCKKLPQCWVKTCRARGGTHKPGCEAGKGDKKKPSAKPAAKATGGGTRRAPKPEPAAVANGNGKFAAHITGLKQAVAAGILAQAELDGYKASLA